MQIANVQFLLSSFGRHFVRTCFYLPEISFVFVTVLSFVSLCVLFYHHMFSAKASIYAKSLVARARVWKRSPVYRSCTVSLETGSFSESLSVNMQNLSVFLVSD